MPKISLVDAVSLAREEAKIKHPNETNERIIEECIASELVKHGFGFDEMLKNRVESALREVLMVPNPTIKKIAEYIVSKIQN